jgi:predicted transposase YdaD
MRLAPLYQQDRDLAVQEGKIEGKIEGETLLIIRQLNRRIGEINSELIAKIQKLSLEKLEMLGEELLDFTKLDDLESWLNQNQE